jgi:hypothetical protein
MCVQLCKTPLIKWPSVSRHGAIDWGTALQAGRSRIGLPMASLQIFTDIILLGSEFESSSNKNEYQEYFIGVKEAGA